MNRQDDMEHRKSLLEHDGLQQEASGAMYDEQDKVRHKKQKYARKFVRETILYGFFMFVYVWSSSYNIPNQAFPLVDSISSNLVRTYWTYTKFYDDIRIIGEFWDFMNLIFVPGLRPTHWYGDLKLKPHEKKFTVYQSYVVGTFRMRQVRVKANSNCLVNKQFNGIVDRCYGEFDTSHEATESFGPWNDTSTNVSSAFRWQSSEELCKAALLEGYCISGAASYPASGYAYDFSMDSATAMQELKYLQDNRWIDLQTRAIIIEFLVYDASVELLAAAQLTSSIAPTGGWVNMVSVKPMPTFELQSTSSKVVLLAEIGLVVFVLVYVLAEFAEFRRFYIVKKTRCGRCQVQRVLNGETTEQKIICIECSRVYNPFRLAECPLCGRETQVDTHMCWKGYFTDFWNWLDIINQVFFLYLFGSRLKMRFTMRNLAFDRGDAFVILYPLAWHAGFINWLNAVNALLCFAKVFKFIGKFKALSALIRTLAKGAKTLAWFTVLFVIVWFGYAFAFHLAFGADVGGCKDWTASMMYTFLALLGDFDYYELRRSQRVLSIILFVTFMVIFVLILTNVFISIVTEAFDEAKEDIRSGKDDYIGSSLNLLLHEIAFKLKLNSGSNMLPEIRRLIVRFESAALGPAQLDDLRAFRNEVEQNPFNTELFSAVITAFGGKVDRPMYEEDFKRMKAAVKIWRQRQRDKEEGGNILHFEQRGMMEDEDSEDGENDVKSLISSGVYENLAPSVASRSSRNLTRKQTQGGKEMTDYHRYQSAMKLVVLNPHQQQIHSALKKSEDMVESLGQDMAEVLKFVLEKDGDDLVMESTSDHEY